MCYTTTLCKQHLKRKSIESLDTIGFANWIVKAMYTCALESLDIIVTQLRCVWLCQLQLLTGVTQLRCDNRLYTRVWNTIDILYKLSLASITC